MADTTIYKKMLKEAGVPLTEAEIQTQWDQLNTASDVRISNESQWSPFWRLISAIATTPVVWLVNLLVNYALPNSFLMHATGSWLDLMAWAVDLERKAATPARGNLVFTRESPDGEREVPAGILVATPAISGRVYRVVTTEAVTMADGVLSALVPVQAEGTGTAYNLGPGYYSVLPEPIDGIASVTNASDWLAEAGANGERDDALRLRCKNQFSAVGQYHHDAAYRADITLFAGIQGDYVWFEHDAPRGPGTANAYIMIDSGCPTQEFVDTINTYIRDEGHHGHGDDMICMPMPTDPQALEVTAYHAGTLSDEDKAALLSGVEDRIRFAFRENQAFEGITRSMPCTRFSFSKLGEELHEQLSDLKSVVFSISDIVPGLELPTLESLTVTLEEF